MPVNQIVIHSKNGNIKKGNTNDFLPNKATFHLTRREGDIEEIKVDECKAIFFVKDLDGDKDYKYAYGDVIPGGGKKVNVDFNDGESIVGYALGYSADRQGFFITPADVSGNNQRVYAVTSSVKKVTFL
ncbi:MAG: hypothetical protein JXL81_10795 [Deltaproteobacteria bacterium]|nr:hypothetical protein [Deltaproteobacteria bacterium]